MEEGGVGRRDGRGRRWRGWRPEGEMRTGVFGRRRSGVRKSQRGVVQGDAVRRGDLALRGRLRTGESIWMTLIKTAGSNSAGRIKKK